MDVDEDSDQCRPLVPMDTSAWVIKGDSNPNYKYVLSEGALGTMNFDASIIKMG